MLNIELQLCHCLLINSHHFFTQSFIVLLCFELSFFFELSQFRNNNIGNVWFRFIHLQVAVKFFCDFFFQLLQHFFSEFAFWVPAFHVHTLKSSKRSILRSGTTFDTALFCFGFVLVLHFLFWNYHFRWLQLQPWWLLIGLSLSGER